MPIWLKSLGLSFFVGYGGIFLVVGAIMSFVVTFRAGRLRAPDWMLAAALNIPLLLFLIDMLRGSPAALIRMYWVIGYGWGGFGVGWILGVFLCVLLWQFRKRSF